MTLPGTEGLAGASDWKQHWAGLKPVGLFGTVSVITTVRCPGQGMGRNGIFTFIDLKPRGFLLPHPKLFCAGVCTEKLSLNFSKWNI